VTFGSSRETPLRHTRNIKRHGTFPRKLVKEWIKLDVLVSVFSEVAACSVTPEDNTDANTSTAQHPSPPSGVGPLLLVGITFG